MTWLWFAPYACAGGVYIAAAWRSDGRLQGVLKPFLVPLLLLARLAAAGWDTLICLGLLLGWLGDLLLMKRGDRWFVAGIGAFLAGHICYILRAVLRAAPALAPWTLGLAVPWAVFAFLLMRSLWPNLGKLRAPVSAYCAVITALAVSGCVWFFSARTATAGLFCLGAIWFVVSDAQLAIGIFDKPAPRQDFLVMSAYILAQLLIAVSSLL